MKTGITLDIAPVAPGQAASRPHRGQSLSIFAVLVSTLLSACHRTASNSPAETPTRGDESVQATDLVAGVKAAESTELRKTVAEARKLAASGSCDEAAA